MQPTMFEPENDLERSFVRAANEPAHRPDFVRTLMDAEIFLALEFSGAPPVAGPDGQMTLPKGTTLTLRSLTKGNQSFVPFFSAPVRAHAIFKSDHVAPEKTRDLFQRYPQAQFVLNPGSEYSKDFLREEVVRLLSGDFGVGFERVHVEEGTRLLIGQPAEYPDKLVAALSAAFEQEPSIAAAHLAQAAYGDKPSHLVIALDIGEDWDALMQRLGPRMRGLLPSTQVVDFVPLTGGGFESYSAPTHSLFSKGTERTTKRT
jgi:hypothetical protein